MSCRVDRLIQFNILSQALFFFMGWLFFVKQLFRDYEVSTSYYDHKILNSTIFRFIIRLSNSCFQSHSHYR